MPQSKQHELRFKRQGHPFHIVNRSPWPFFVSFNVLTITFGAVLYMHRIENGGTLLLWGIIALIGVIAFWFRDIIAEATYEGHHTRKVRAGLRFGMKLFIISEVMFFFSFFWAFFHSALAPQAFIGHMWPPHEFFPQYAKGGFYVYELDKEGLRAEYDSLIADDCYGLEMISFDEYKAWRERWIWDVPHWVLVKTCIDPAKNDDGYRWAFIRYWFYDPYTIPLAATFILLTSGLTLHIAGLWFKFAGARKTKWPLTLSARHKMRWIVAKIYTWNDEFEAVYYDLYFKLYKKKAEKLARWIPHDRLIPNAQDPYAYMIGYYPWDDPSRRAASYAVSAWLGVTIILGLIFTFIQLYEYTVLLSFSINDSIFGSCFYMLTGFHGLHVIIGTIGLMICFWRHHHGHFTKTVHVGFECAAWYWHFVDGVWIFVYFIVYWWSTPLPDPICYHYEDKDLDASCDSSRGAAFRDIAWTYEAFLELEQEKPKKKRIRYLQNIPSQDAEYFKLKKKNEHETSIWYDEHMSSVFWSDWRHRYVGRYKMPK